MIDYELDLPLSLRVHPDIAGFEEVVAIESDMAWHEHTGVMDVPFYGHSAVAELRSEGEDLTAAQSHELSVLLSAHLSEAEIDDLTTDADRNFVPLGPVTDLPDELLLALIERHVQKVAGEQLRFEERYPRHAQFFDRKLREAIEARLVPWFAADNFENILDSEPWVLDKISMKARVGERAAAFVTRNGEVFIRPELWDEQGSVCHEFTHLLSFAPEDVTEDVDRDRQNGLRRFPIAGISTVDHRWLNEAETEHQNMVILGRERGVYTPERELRSALLRTARPGLGQTMAEAYFASEDTWGIEYDALKVYVYDELNKAALRANLGTLTDIELNSRLFGNDYDARDRYFMNLAACVDNQVAVGGTALSGAVQLA